MAGTAAIIGAVGSVIGAGTSLYSAMNKNTTGSTLSDVISLKALQDAENQQAYTNAQTALADTLAKAGYSDSYGSTVQYNPATNTWETKLGKLPEQESTAAAQSAISRNTTDVRQAQYANEQAMRRASENDPLVSAARIAYQSFQPRTVDELAGLLQTSAVNAENDTNRPIISDTLRSFARTGTAAGPVLSNLEQTNAKSIRDTIIDARIKALENNASINATNQGNLLKNYTSLMSASTPNAGSFNYPTLSTTDPNTALQNIATGSQQKAQTTASYSGDTSAKAQNATNTAASTAASNIGNTDTNAATESVQSIGKTISDLTQNKNIQSVLSDLFSGKSSTGGTGKITYYSENPSAFGSTSGTADELNTTKNQSGNID